MKSPVILALVGLFVAITVLGLFAQAAMTELRESTGDNPLFNGTSRTTVVEPTP